MMPRTKKNDAPVNETAPLTPETPSAKAKPKAKAQPAKAEATKSKPKAVVAEPTPAPSKPEKPSKKPAVAKKAEPVKAAAKAEKPPVVEAPAKAKLPQPKPKAAKPAPAPTPKPVAVAKPSAPPTKAGLFGKPKAAAPAPVEEAAQRAPKVEKAPEPRVDRKAAPVKAEAPAPAEESREQSRSRNNRNRRNKRPSDQAEARQPEPKPAEAPKKPEPKESRKPAPLFKQAKLTGDPVIDELPVPTWRTAAPKAEGAESQPAPRSEAGPLAPRKSSNRRGKDRAPTAADAQTKPVEEAAQPTNNQRGRRGRRGPVEEAPEAKQEAPAPQQREQKRRPFGKAAVAEPPPVKVREPIPVHADAPRVTLLNGVPTLTHRRKVYPPLAFFGSSPSERQVQMVLDQVKMAADRGVQIFGHLVELEVNRDSVGEAVAVAAYLLKETIARAPESRVFFRVVFAAPKNWDKQFPRAKFIAEGGGLAEPSLSDDEFWTEAEQCLEEFIRQVRRLPMEDHILGLHLERGEWFFADGWGYDTSLAAHDKFREWVRVRYRDDVVTLRASWFDGQVQFESVSIPEYSAEARAGEEFVRTGRKARRWVDYHLFLSDMTHDRITKLAYRAKMASEGRFLVGVSYGYTFEWSHPASGHLSLGKLLRAPEIDFIAGPPSYKNREPGGSSPFPTPIDSFALNGKLYISEEDFKTPISGKVEPDDFNPVMRTPQALESVHWRGAGAALAHRSGICWMDLWGNGWLNSPGIWDRGSDVIGALLLNLVAPSTDPDVAVFIDERSLSYLVDQRAFTLLVQNVREAVLRSGLSVGFYLLSDLAHRENFPESKLYVFANAWDLRPEVRSAIKNRLQRDGKLLFWLYSAGLFEAGRESLERVREVMGIALRRQPFASKPGTTILQRRHPLGEALPEKSLYGGGSLEPSYFAIPEEGLVIGEYSATGLPSFIHKEFRMDDHPDQHWQSVFLGEPIVTPALFRALGQMAGAHVWNYSEDVVHVRAPFLTVHCQGAGPRTITLPDRWTAYNLLHESWSEDSSNQLRFHANDGSTHTFLVGLRAEIEALLSLDLDTLLELDEVPEIPKNTLDQSMNDFDVPIMKLDEWMEESWSDEMEGDFLLKPSQLEFEAEELEPASSGGRRGRRRRRWDDRKGSEEVVTARREGADAKDPYGELAMNIVFRKRE